jgi:hypothetical protein
MFHSVRTLRADTVAGGAIALIMVLTIAACGGAAASPAPASPAPSQPAPTEQPSEQPSEAPASEAPASEAPSPVPSQGNGEIILDVPGGHVISVVVTDRGVGLAGAESGKAGDGMSVRWGDALVENLDAQTLEVTFVGFPQDETVGVVLEPKGDKVVIRFGQNAPYPNTDALGADRVMVFSFDQPVSADDVVVEFTTADD